MLLYLGLIKASSISIKVAGVEVIERYGKYGWPMDTYHPQNMATAHKDLGPLPSREMGAGVRKFPHKRHKNIKHDNIEQLGSIESALIQN